MEGEDLMFVVNPAENLQFLQLGPEHQEIMDILHASTQRWLNAQEYQVLFENRQLFPIVNPNAILPGVEGFYRVDNDHMRDQNVWAVGLTSVREKLRVGGQVRFDGRIARAATIVDFEYNVVAPGVVAGWKFTRIVYCVNCYSISVLDI